MSRGGARRGTGIVEASVELCQRRFRRAGADVRDAADFGGRYAIRVQHEDHLAAALLELSIMAINDYRDYMESNQEDVSPAESEESEESEDPQ